MLGRNDLRHTLWLHMKAATVCDLHYIASSEYHVHTSDQRGVADALLVTACNTLSERYAQNLHDPVQQPVNDFKA